MINEEHFLDEIIGRYYDNHEIKIDVDLVVVTQDSQGNNIFNSKTVFHGFYGLVHNMNIIRDSLMGIRKKYNMHIINNPNEYLVFHGNCFCGYGFSTRNLFDFCDDVKIHVRHSRPELRQNEFEAKAECVCGNYNECECQPVSNAEF